MPLPMEFETSQNDQEQFEKFLRRIVGRDNRYYFLLVPEFIEERTDFYNYFKSGLSAWQALQKEYQEYA